MTARRRPAGDGVPSAHDRGRHRPAPRSTTRGRRGSDRRRGGVRCGRSGAAAGPGHPRTRRPPGRRSSAPATPARDDPASAQLPPAPAQTSHSESPRECTGRQPSTARDRETSPRIQSTAADRAGPRPRSRISPAKPASLASSSTASRLVTARAAGDVEDPRRQLAHRDRGDAPRPPRRARRRSRGTRRARPASPPGRRRRGLPRCQPGRPAEQVVRVHAGPHRVEHAQRHAVDPAGRRGEREQPGGGQVA